jgi:hypothetical protein
LHVFVALHFGVQIKILDIETHEFGVWRRNDAVEDNFGRGDVSGRCADIVGVIDQVTAYDETGSMGFLFLGTDCADCTLLCGQWALGCD